MEQRASSLLEASSRSKHQLKERTTNTTKAMTHFNECTKITLQIDGRVCSTEMEGNEHTATEIIEAFVGLMVGQTFTERTCYKAMNNIAEERYTEDES
jgi:outer membrane protein assembly factor BamA